MFSPDGKTLVTGRERGPLRVWDVECGTERFAVANGWTGMNRCAVQFSPDSMILAAHQIDGDLNLWDTLSGKELATIQKRKTGRSGFPDFCFSPDGEFLAIDDSSTGWPDRQFIKFWNISAKKEQGRIEGRFWNMRFSPDSRSVATCAQSSNSKIDRVLLWNLDSPPPSLLKEYQVSASDIVFSPDLTTFVQFTSSLDPKKPGETALVELDTGMKRCSLTHPEEGFYSQELSFAPNGRIFLANDLRGGSLSFTTKTTLWELTSNPKKLGGFPEKPAVSPDGQWLAVPRDTGVRLLEMATMKEHSNLTKPNDSLGSSGPCIGDGFSLADILSRLQPGGCFQAVLSSTGLSHVYVAAKTHQSIPGTFPFSVTRLWDVETGKELAEFVDCREVVFSPDGKALTTLSEDRTVQLWEVPPRKPLGRILVWTTGIWLVVMLGAWCVQRLIRRSRRHAS